MYTQKINFNIPGLNEYVKLYTVYIIPKYNGEVNFIQISRFSIIDYHVI